MKGFAVKIVALDRGASDPVSIAYPPHLCQIKGAQKMGLRRKSVADTKQKGKTLKLLSLFSFL